MRTFLSPTAALRRFGFKQALRGAIIVSIIAAFMLALQGIAYQKSYPDAAAREKFATTLAAAPGLGFLYGDPKNLDAGTAGYMAYRVLGVMGVVTSAWALLATTKLLRGSEEDGRWETVRTGAVTARAATGNVMIGFTAAWLLAAVISLFATVLTTASAGINLSFYEAVLLNLAIFLPGLLFAGVGVFTSQLALSRQRALMYGLVPLAALFLLRGIANTTTNLHWLRAWTPFGWAELINPILAPQPWWLVPFIGLGILLAWLGVYFANRDFDSSIIPQSDTARSWYGLLGSAWSLVLRQSGWVLTAWMFGALCMTGLIASLTTTAINATADSNNLSRSVHSLAGNSANLKVAFLGAGMVFLVMVLLIFAIALIGAIRRDEAKQYLDNVLVAPQRRTSWLAGRIVLGFSIILATSLMSALLLYTIASSQDIALNFGKVMATSIAAVGSVGFMLGVGALLYGLKPRLATPVMYAIVAWSFLIDLIASAAKLNTVLLHSSLFHYISFNLADWPNWGTFGTLMAIGIVLAAFGLGAFNRRDIIPE